MQRDELYADNERALMVALEAKQAEMWTSLPGIIESYDSAAQTASVQPAIKGWMRDERGQVRYVDLPLLVDVPVEFPAGGGFTLTFPVKPGDECVVELQSRCIDGWWQAGGIQEPLEKRMHDLSDGICRVGVRSQARRLTPAPDTSDVQLRSDDGQAHVSIQPDHAIRLENPGGHLNLTASGELALKALAKISLEAPQVEIVGDQVDILGAASLNLLAGALTLLFNAMSGGSVGGGAVVADMSNVELLLKEMEANGIKFTPHVHPGVATGNGNTGAPR